MKEIRLMFRKVKINRYWERGRYNFYTDERYIFREDNETGKITYCRGSNGFHFKAMQSLGLTKEVGNMGEFCCMALGVVVFVSTLILGIVQ